MIVSSVKGRIRIRDERLKRGVFADGLKRRLESSGELFDVCINQRVGSMLIIYNPSVTDNKRLFELVGEDVVAEDILRNAPKKGGNKKILPWQIPEGITKVHKKVMLFSLTTSLLGIAFGLKKYHIIAGLIFVGAWGIHIFTYRKMVLK